MNFTLIARHLGIVSILIGGSMAFSIPWAWPALSGSEVVESTSVRGLSISLVISVAVGAGLLLFGRKATGHMFRREALAVVGLSWVLATILGALPFLLSGICIGPAPDIAPDIAPDAAPDAAPGSASIDVSDGGADSVPAGVPMTIAEALFESASGFSGTGATVITDLESPHLVPRAILFWRSETHFLGGLGILVLFVAILGQGASAKAVMRAELPGPTMDTSHARIQHTARNFAAIYVGLNAILTGLLLLEGMSVFDALCHSFGTIATGGFSTYNASAGHFDSPAIELTLTVFMAISCVNFALLNTVLLLKPGTLLRDHEFRLYLTILAVSTLLVTGYGLHHGDFDSVWSACRYGSFQVTSVMTNTGFGTHDFDQWNTFSKALLLVLMFVGGCAGSTSCSIKVVRYLLVFKGLRLEIDRAWRPNLVRTVWMDGKVVDPSMMKHVYFYFSLIGLIFVVSWLGLMFLEPETLWSRTDVARGEPFIDCASAVAACLNGVGPGLGVVGPTQNYAALQEGSKLLLTALMLLGRLECIPILVLLMPRFWRNHG